MTAFAKKYLYLVTMSYISKKKAELYDVMVKNLVFFVIKSEKPM